MIEWTHSLAGALTGFVIGLTGVGGGALMAPILLLVFDISVATVVATDLWFAALTKLAAIRIYKNHDYVDWKIAKYLWLGSIPASLLIIYAIVSKDITKISSSLLHKGIGFLVLLSAFGLVAGDRIKKMKIETVVPGHFKGILPHIPNSHLLATTVAGLFLGVIVTLSSIGAGLLGTVILLYIYSTKLTPKHIIATEIAHAIPLALIAGIGYSIYGTVDVYLLIGLLIGSIPTAILGASVAHKIDSKWVKIFLALILFLAGFKLFI